MFYCISIICKCNITNNCIKTAPWTAWRSHGIAWCLGPLELIDLSSPIGVEQYYGSVHPYSRYIRVLVCFKLAHWIYVSYFKVFLCNIGSFLFKNVSIHECINVKSTQRMKSTCHINGINKEENFQNRTYSITEFKTSSSYHSIIINTIHMKQ